MKTHHIITLAMLLVIVVTFSQAVTAQTIVEEISIQNANTAINQAFTSVLEAEKAGGNVTQLLITLNIAGDLLSKAENAYEAGYLANVTVDAENARSIADKVNSDAIASQEVSIVASQNNLLYTLTFSIIGIVIFSLVLLVVWRRFKASYMKRLLGMKPEVVED